MELIIENNTARVQKQHRNDDGAYCTGNKRSRRRARRSHLEAVD